MEDAPEHARGGRGLGFDRSAATDWPMARCTVWAARRPSAAWPRHGVCTLQADVVSVGDSLAPPLAANESGENGHV